MKKRYFKSNYYEVNSNVKSVCFIYPDLCYCGHEKYYHSNLEKCNSSQCKCTSFLP